MSRKDQLSREIREVLEQVSGEDLAPGDLGTAFVELGFDSLLLTQIAQKLSHKYGVALRLRQLLEDLSSVSALAAHLDDALPKTAAQIAEPPPRAPQRSAPASQGVTIDAVAPLTPGSGSVLERVIAAQLVVMRQQLELVTGARSSAATAVLPVASPDGEARAVGTTEAQPATEELLPSISKKKGFGPQLHIERGPGDAFTPEQQRHFERLVHRYTEKTRTSKAFTQRNRAHLSDPRSAAGFKPRLKEVVYPIVVDRSDGCRLWDLDGNEYIDLLNGYGSNFLGYSPAFVRDAMKAQLDHGIEIGPQHPLTEDVSRLLCELTGSERVAFCNTGSEAVLATLRIARTVTGRSTIALFNGSYHGLFDEVIVRGTKKLTSVPAAPGIPREAVQNVLVLDYGDPKSLEILRARASELAAVLVEPVQSRRPELVPVDFCHELRRITETSGAALIFDEVVTGFRAAPGGAQERFGITADLATYGKVIGGGLSIGIVGGKRRFMDALDGGFWQFGDDSVPEAGVTYFAGTFVRHPLALAATRAVLEHLKAQGPGFQRSVDEKAARFAATLNAWLETNGVPLRISQWSSILKVAFTEEVPYGELLFLHLRESGVHVFEHRPSFLTAAHTDHDVDVLIERVKGSVAELWEGGFLPRPASVRFSRAELETMAGGELSAVAPCTEEQQELWTAIQVGGELANLAYNESVSLALRGALDSPALERALHRLLTRHEALRATFTPDGETLCVRREPRLVLEQVDLSGMTGDVVGERLSEVRARAVGTPFDLVRGPLVRFTLVRVSATEHELVVTAHHIVCDGWSFGVVLPELSALYTEAITGVPASLPEPVPFSEYARRERLFSGSPEAAANEAFWMSRYATDVPLLDLPVDRSRPPDRSFEAAREDMLVPAELVRKLRELGKTAGTSFVATLLAGFEAFLYRLSGQRTFAVAMPAAGQAITGEHCLVGHAVHTLPLRAEVDPDASFLACARRVQADLLDAFDHQRFTFGTLMKRLPLARDPSRVPLSPVMFNLDRAIDGLRFSGLEVRYATNPRIAENFEIFVNATETEEGIVLETTYNTSLWARDTIRLRLEELLTLLEGAVECPTATVAELPLLPEREQKLLDDWNCTKADLPAERTLAALFEAQVRRTPHSIAVTSDSGELRYAELDARANQLAHALSALGVRDGDRVGISVERGPALVVAILGVAKAGATYVPLDPDFPAARLAFIAEDARIQALVTQLSIAGVLPGLAKVVLLDAERTVIDAQSTEPPPRIDDPEAVLYVLHTSGSTGKPKGVEVTQGAVANFLVSMARRPGLTKDDVLVAVTTLSFDIAVLEIFLPLTVGGKVAIVSREVAMDGARLGASIALFGATIMQATPSTWRLLLEADVQFPPGFKALVGGEVFPRDLAAQLLQRTASVWNMYGPTETTIWSTCHSVTAESGAVPIGRPIANTRLYVLDEYRRRAPIGAPGELYIGGAGVARGYLGRPELTRERFVDSPFEPGDRLYRTGDIVRWSDGALVFERRVDGQVKVRGYRIELGEIEAVVGADPAVKECLAMVREDRASDQRIVLYAVIAKESTASQDDLRRIAAQSLPSYMVPQHFVVLDALPRTPNGKVDRHALPPPDGEASTTEHVAPRTEVESKIARIWQEMLGVSRVGIHDDFFALGGHSMLATRLLSRIRDALGVDVGLRRLFRASTVAGLAEHVEAALIVRSESQASPAAEEMEEVVI